MSEKKEGRIIAVKGINCHDCDHERGLVELCAIEDQKILENLSIHNKKVYCGCFQARTEAAK